MATRGSGTQPRRIAVAKHPGVYYREGADGRRRYEITYTDSDGRRRWQVVRGADLKAAQAKRNEILGRIDRGDRVAPSKATVRDVAALWLASQAQLRPRTRERYENALDCHVLPRLGRLKVSELRKAHVVELIAAMHDGRCWRRRNDRGELVVPALAPDGPLVEVRRTAKGVALLDDIGAPARPFAGWSIRGALTPLSGLMEYAVEEGLAASNPVAKLTKKQRPTVAEGEMRVLERGEIAKLLRAAGDRYRPLLATAVYSGLRLGEVLGLTWADVDFDGHRLYVRKQLGRDGVRVEPKTKKAKRAVVLMPELAGLLREHKLRSSHSRPDDFVFASLTGSALQARNVVRRGLEAAITRAGLDGDGKPKLRFHDLRHTYASALIAAGCDVYTVSRQIGHASASITLNVYAHKWDEQRQEERVSEALEAAFGTPVGNGPRPPAANGGEVLDAEVLSLSGIGS